MPSHVIIENYQSGSAVLSSTVTITDDTELGVDETLSASASNVEVDVAFTRSKVKSMGIYCAGDCTIKTNSSSSPGDTITLTAGQLIVLSSTSQVTAQFSADVTKLYLSSTAGGLFQIRAILHSSNP